MLLFQEYGWIGKITQAEEVIIHKKLGAHVRKPNVCLTMKCVHQSTHQLLIKRSDLIDCAGLSLV